MLGVIFDLDGTLLDTQRICIPAWDYAGKIQQVDIKKDAIKDVCGMNEQGWTQYLLDNYMFLDVNKFKVDVREYILRNLVVKFKPGAIELIKFLKDNDIKIAVASGTDTEGICEKLNAVGGLEFFDEIIGGQEVQNGKPHPDIFLLAAKRLGCKPEECIVFEDSANGINASYNANIKCFGIPDVAEFDNDTKGKMVKELSSLEEAIEIIKNMK